MSGVRLNDRPWERSLAQLEDLLNQPGLMSPAPGEVAFPTSLREASEQPLRMVAVDIDESDDRFSVERSSRPTPHLSSDASAVDDSETVCLRAPQGPKIDTIDLPPSQPTSPASHAWATLGSAALELLASAGWIPPGYGSAGGVPRSPLELNSLLAREAQRALLNYASGTTSEESESGSRSRGDSSDGSSQIATVDAPFPFSGDAVTAIALAHAGHPDALCRELSQIASTARQAQAHTQLLKRIVERTRAESTAAQSALAATASSQAATIGSLDARVEQLLAENAQLRQQLEDAERTWQTQAAQAAEREAAATATALSQLSAIMRAQVGGTGAAASRRTTAALSEGIERLLPSPRKGGSAHSAAATSGASAFSASSPMSGGPSVGVATGPSRSRGLSPHRSAGSPRSEPGATSAASPQPLSRLQRKAAPIEPAMLHAPALGSPQPMSARVSRADPAAVPVYARDTPPLPHSAANSVVSEVTASAVEAAVGRSRDRERNQTDGPGAGAFDDRQNAMHRPAPMMALLPEHDDFDGFDQPSAVAAQGSGGGVSGYLSPTKASSGKEREVAQLPQHLARPRSPSPQSARQRALAYASLAMLSGVSDAPRSPSPGKARARPPSRALSSPRDPPAGSRLPVAATALTLRRAMPHSRQEDSPPRTLTGDGGVGLPLGARGCTSSSPALLMPFGRRSRSVGAAHTGPRALMHGSRPTAPAPMSLGPSVAASPPSRSGPPPSAYRGADVMDTPGLAGGPAGSAVALGGTPVGVHLLAAAKARIAPVPPPPQDMARRRLRERAMERAGSSIAHKLLAKKQQHTQLGRAPGGTAVVGNLASAAAAATSAAAHLGAVEGVRSRAASTASSGAGTAAFRFNDAGSVA